MDLFDKNDKVKIILVIDKHLANEARRAATSQMRSLSSFCRVAIADAIKKTYSFGEEKK